MTTAELETISRISNIGCRLTIDSSVIVIDMTGTEILEIETPEQGFDMTKLLSKEIRNAINEESIYSEILENIHELI